MHEREPDRSEHRGLADTVERRVEKRAEHRSLARRPRERPVEDVQDRAHDEQRSPEPEEEELVAGLEADEHRAREAERDACEREHVGCELRPGDTAHRPPQDLPRGLHVLLLDAVELVDARPLPGRARGGGRRALIVRRGVLGLAHALAP